MRASPAFRIRIRRQGLWRVAVGALLVATVSVQIAWLVARLADASLAETLAWTVMDAALVAAAAGALRVEAADLLWDTHRWRLAPAGAEGEAAVAGRLTIALDLGAWMLLRFDADEDAGAPRRRRWLPVQRRGLEPQWHALRCAVYCARPAVGHDAGAAPGAGPTSQE